MAIFKCKMCGGSLEIHNNESVAECEYCGTKQTMPKSLDGVIQNLFNRANNLRIKGDFDKAEQIYEKILDMDNTEAEAHWGVVLCKYGIEYVEDPKTVTQIPTCHRTNYESITTNSEYTLAIEYADSLQREIYEKEAEQIDKIQRHILNIAQNEAPFDVFICYKETDENGQRTVDSVIANDIYYQLEQEGLKVFYAAITLEDKLGEEYEPYIFAALNSSKVMLVIGTNPEYFNAVWVKNEWSRFLKLISNDRSKSLIPCYRDMDAYDLPEEFSHLQAQDMSKIGFISDIIRGVKKIVSVKEKTVTRTGQDGSQLNNINPLIKRAYLFLEDAEFNRADDCCEQVLNMDPENAEAYIIKLMIDFKSTNTKQLEKLGKKLSESKNYSKIIRFGNNTQIEFIQNIEKTVEKNIATIEQKRLEDIDRIREEEARKNKIYDNACKKACYSDIASCEEAIKEFSSIIDWKDTKIKIKLCENKIEEIKAKQYKREERKSIFIGLILSIIIAIVGILLIPRLW